MIEQLKHASVGTPITRGGVTLIPVYLQQDSPQILTGVDAEVEVTEQPGAEVPTLVATNRHGVPVLVAEGETLNGGWQNRVVNVSVLLPANGSLDIPVSCVEAGRWGGDRTFDRRGPKAPRRVRRGATRSVTENLQFDQTRRSDQGLVWAMVSDELRGLDVENHSAAVEGLIDHERRNADVAAAIADLVRRGPLRGQCGVIVAHGRRIVALDVYATPEMLAASWENLVRGYFLEVRRAPSGTPSATKALRFLTKIAKRVVSTQPGVGLGDELRISSSKITGQALVYEGALVHASAFALAA